MKTLALALSLSAAGLPSIATAQQVRDCDTWEVSARNVDWSDPTRTFANGAIRLVALDTEEPAAASFHVMVTFPHPDDPFLDCRLISNTDGSGFSGISLSRATADYDPARGLTVRVPAREAAAVHDTPLSLDITVDQAAGAVGVRFRPP
ncbi:MAG: hypothetical protein WBA25_13975 [Jannaschia sp.]